MTTTLREYFIHANSFAAPIASDTSTEYVSGSSAEDALETFVKQYSHPAGLCAAACYESADDMHKGKKALAQWKSNFAIAVEEATKGLGSYSYSRKTLDAFEIDGKTIKVKNPKGGRVV